MTGQISAIACKKIYVILNELNLFNNLPDDKQIFIREKRDPNYKFDYNKNMPLEEQIQDKETRIVLSYLFLKYINKDKQIKQVFLYTYKKNELEYQQKIKEEYNPDNLFKKREMKKEEQSLVVIPKEKWYIKIISFLKNMMKF